LALSTVVAVTLTGVSAAGAQTGGGAAPTSLVSSPNPSVFSQPVTFTASVAGPCGPTGTVTFLAGGPSGTVLGTGTLNSQGAATFTTSSLRVGQTAVVARYDGNATCASNVSNTVFQNVTPAQTTTTLSSSNNPSAPGQPITLTAQVLSLAPATAPPNTGTVSFYVGNSFLGSVPVSNGTATFTTSFNGGGPFTLYAVFTDSPEFAPSAASISQAVSRGTTTSVTTSPNPSAPGQPVVLTATVKPVALGGAIPTGSVSFFDGATFIGSAPLVAGVAQLTLPAFSVGSHAIVAAFNGSVLYDPSSSTAVTQSVVSTTLTTLTSAPNPSSVGQPVTFTATVSPTVAGAPAPTGTVSFFNGASFLGVANLTNGVATFTTSALPAGSNVIMAYFNGSSYAPSASAAVVQNVI